MKCKHDKTQQFSLFSCGFTKKHKETPDILSTVTSDDELPLPSSSAALSPPSPPVATPHTSKAGNRLTVTLVSGCFLAYFHWPIQFSGGLG